MIKKLLNLFGKKKSAETSTTSDEWAPKQSTISAEELCEIDPITMSKESIREHLAVLYKRHNSAVSSIKPELRTEARQMLEAIAECRQRYIDEFSD